MTDTPEIAQRKKAARKAAEAARSSAHAAMKDIAALSLARNGLDFAGPLPGRTVSAFIPFGDEIDTRPLLAKLASEGFTTCVPVVLKPATPLEFRAWVPGEETAPGRWNIPVPPDTADVVVPDVLLVPLLAFDRLGYRLGYGGGFFDRTIEGLRAMKPIIAIGVAYSAQRVDEVVRGEHDQKLDWILTEKGPMKVEQGS
jgi:5-formyltetrahydrofolate cyclo-ligase